MCCLFGLIDYGHSLSRGQRTRLLTVLATACEARGTDAAGIAYHSRGQLYINKRPGPAHKLRIRIPGDSWTVIGHTRMTTQGSQAHNYNNHPFSGTTEKGPFALAHNGVIRNDLTLRKALRLPKTRIETDSYVAVQLLEREGSLNLESLENMAEQLEGSFTFTLLGPEGEFYLVKGNSPMCLYHYPRAGVYLYASTEEILLQALRQLQLPLGKPVRISTLRGEILKICADGNILRGQFDASNLYAPWYPMRWHSYPTWGQPVRYPKPTSYLDEIKSVASAFGYSPEEIDRLAREGISPEELEEFLYCGEL